jgi:signal transduction histidine kinase
LADLSAGFVNLAADKVDAAITDSLRRVCEVLDVDRASLIRFADGSGVPRVTHSGATLGYLEGSPGKMMAVFPWAIPRLMAGQTIAFCRWEELPEEAAVDRATWQKYGVKSCLAVPLHVAGAIEGCIALDCQRVQRVWAPDLIDRMQVMTTVFGSALAHKRTSQDLEAAIAFERMAADIMSSLLQAPRTHQDSVLEAGLRQVAQAFGADRATLWQRVGDTAEFSKSHRWTADSQVAALPLPAAGLRWVNAQMLRGSVVRFACHADLPAEAATDLPALQTLGIGAAVIVPLQMSGRVAGALSIADSRELVEWPDVLLPRAQLLGQAFASFTARQQAEQGELQAQAQAAHAARVATLGVFATSLVHELTQPLAASLANAETARSLLALPAPALDEVRDTVADIVTDSRRAGELIQKLRRFLRHGEAEHGAIEVHALMTEVLSFVASESAGKGITITRDVREGLPSFVGDRVQMQQVLLNLLLNAFDAVSSRATGERRVQLRAYAAASGLAIEVRSVCPHARGCAHDRTRPVHDLPVDGRGQVPVARAPGQARRCLASHRPRAVERWAPHGRPLKDASPTGPHAADPLRAQHSAIPHLYLGRVRSPAATVRGHARKPPFDATAFACQGQLTGASAYSHFRPQPVVQTAERSHRHRPVYEVLRT